MIQMDCCYYSKGHCNSASAPKLGKSHCIVTTLTDVVRGTCGVYQEEVLKGISIATLRDLAKWLDKNRYSEIAGWHLISKDLERLRNGQMPPGDRT
jgi:hypothetical protein